MYHRGRPLTRRQEMEAKEKHGRAMNAVLEELKVVQAAKVEERVAATESPAQHRARQWQKESGLELPRQPRSPAPHELANVAAGHLETPANVGNEFSFSMKGERGAGTAPPQAVGKVPGVHVHDVAAAREQHSRAATQEVLMTPHIRRSVYGRESRGAVSEGQFGGRGGTAMVGKQPSSTGPHEVLTFTNVICSVGAGSSPREGGRAEDQGQGSSSVLRGLGLPRPSMDDPYGHSSMPPSGGKLSEQSARANVIFATPPGKEPALGQGRGRVSSPDADQTFTGVEDQTTLQQQERGRVALQQSGPQQRILAGSARHQITGGVVVLRGIGRRVQERIKVLQPSRIHQMSRAE